MRYFNITIGIFLALAASRFIPHPPNFASLIALGFYIPEIFGLRFIPSILIALLISDILLGFHSKMFFPFFSLKLIGFISRLLREIISFNTPRSISLKH